MPVLIRCCCSCTREVLMLKPLVPFVKERRVTYTLSSRLRMCLRGATPKRVSAFVNSL